MHPEPIGVAQFIEACASAHADLARIKNVTLEFESTVGLASFDAGQMRSALDNLVLNALQAAPRGTPVVITASQTANKLLFFVRDEGPGPPQPVRESSISRFHGNLIGSSRAMRAIQKTIGMVTDSIATVPIMGETGTGKGLAARAIHNTVIAAESPSLR